MEELGFCAGAAAGSDGSWGIVGECAAGSEERWRINGESSAGSEASFSSLDNLTSIQQLRQHLEADAAGCGTRACVEELEREADSTTPIINLFESMVHASEFVPSVAHGRLFGCSPVRLGRPDDGSLEAAGAVPLERDHRDSTSLTRTISLEQEIEHPSVTCSESTRRVLIYPVSNPVQVRTSRKKTKSEKRKARMNADQAADDRLLNWFAERAAASPASKAGVAHEIVVERSRQAPSKFDVLSIVPDEVLRRTLAGRASSSEGRTSPVGSWGDDS